MDSAAMQVFFNIFCMIFSVFLPRRALLAVGVTQRTQKPDENGTDSVIPNRYTPALSDIFYPPK